MRESSGLAPNLSSLPAGGGAVSPLGDRFQPDLLRGSGSYTIDVTCPKGPNELAPTLTLDYSTGSGAGAFGMGWRLSLPRIERRTDRGVPTYADTDTFVLGETDTLVAVGDGRFRPRTDAQSWLIERTEDGWRVRVGDGRAMLFGQTAASREADGNRIFAWHLDEEQDAAGNSIRYTYRRDLNRLYLQEVSYSVFRVRFDYEQRPDPIRNGRAGFARVTALRARTIDVLCDRLPSAVMRRYTLDYEQAGNGASMLTGVGVCGIDGGQRAHAPGLSFEYSAIDFADWAVSEAESLVPPPGLDDRSAQLVDLTGDGLPDVVQSLGSRMLVWHNRGNGRLDGPSRLRDVPSTVTLARDNVAFADLDGDGRVELFAVDQPLQLCYTADGRGGFAAEPVIFTDRPQLRLASPRTRLMDVDGDGVTDLISTERDHLLLFRHRTGVGWQDPDVVARTADLDRFPDVSFGDRGVRLADMTGDGLADIVVVRGGDVAYWPYLGHGRWAERVPMANPPQFPPRYLDSRVHVVDVDGDGCADIVYLDGDRTLIWLNRAGNGFGPPFEIPVAPRRGDAQVIAVDFLGDGRPGLLWSGVPARTDGTGHRFLRIDGGRTPYLMTAIHNGMGRTTRVDYTTSTALRAEDAQTGDDWQGQLPFAVPVVRRIRDGDAVAGSETTLSIRYRDGVYDGREREFRGFQTVTVTTAGDESIPECRQEYRFLHGDPDDSDLTARQRARTLSGALRSVHTYEATDAGFALRHASEQQWDARLEHTGTTEVYRPLLALIESREISPTGAATRIERTRLLDYDLYGNAGRRVREYLAEGDPAVVTEDLFSYTANEDEWLVKLPVRAEQRDHARGPLAVTIHHYDGAPFVGLPEGQATRGLLTRTRELRLADARLPADYVGGRDMAALGYTHEGTGYFVTTFAAQRDARGNIVGRRDPLGAATTFDYDGEGVHPTRSTGPRGEVIEAVFDPRAGEPVRMALPGGRVIRLQIDPLGRTVARYELADGGEQLVTAWVINCADDRASVTSFEPADPGRTLDEFRAADDPATIDGARVTRTFLDGFGNQTLTITTGPDGPAGRRRYVATRRRRLNARKLVAAEYPPVFVPGFAFVPAPDPAEAHRRHRYDAQGQLVDTAGPGPARFRVIRDTFTLRHFEGDAAGPFGTDTPAGPPTRTEHFDAQGRVARVEERMDDETTITTAFDVATDGRLEVLRDDGGEPVGHYSYAGPGEAVRIAHRDAGTRTYYRDAADRLVELTRPDGSRLTYLNDQAGRPVRIDHITADGVSQTVRELFYDNDPGAPAAGRFLEGRLALVREGGNEFRYSYDRTGHPVRAETTVSGATLSMSWEHNLRHEMTATFYPDGHRATHTRDDSGRVQRITDALSGVSYNADGDIDGYTLANGIAVEMPRDPSSRRLTAVSASSAAGNVLRRVEFGYDTVGNVVAQRDELPGAEQEHSFAYDGLYRLIGYEARGNGTPQAERYAYTAAGDILSRAGTVPQTCSYDDPGRPGRLTAVTRGAVHEPVRYDRRGAISAWGALTDIRYDALDRLTDLRLGDGTQIRFAYDPQNRRILKRVTTGATSDVRYAGSLYEQHATGSVRHIHLGNLLVASHVTTAAGTQRKYYAVDHHGSVLLATDAAGGVLGQQRYSPFGQPLVPGSSLDRYLGIEADHDAELLQLGARYYAPALGRFLSPDWYVIENPTRTMRMPQGFNAYSYAMNNPVAFKDPTGKFFMLPFVAGFLTGLVYGLADGEGWDAFGTALETSLTVGFGASLGSLATGMAAAMSGVPALGIAGAAMGGMNGLFTGIRGTYDWSAVEGWAAFTTDSTWGLMGTSLGNALNVVNLLTAPSSYNGAVSFRQNRQVYDRGFALEGSSAFTQGNVISNLRGRDLVGHETVHILQNRIFGPLYIQSNYVWYLAGAQYGWFLGLVIWPFTGQDPFRTIRDLAYSNNPFERWAYAIQGNDIGAEGELVL